MQSITSSNQRFESSDLAFCRIANRHHKETKRKHQHRRNRTELAAIAMCGASAAFILGAVVGLML